MARRSASCSGPRHHQHTVTGTYVQASAAGTNGGGGFYRCSQHDPNCPAPLRLSKDSGTGQNVAQWSAGQEVHHWRRRQRVVTDEWATPEGQTG